MKIGIDCRFWSEAGVGRYIRNLVFELSKIDKKNEYYLLLLKKDLDIVLPENFHKVEADIRWYTVREQKEILKILNKLDLDLVHFPHFNFPIFYNKPFIVTIHDLIHKHFSMSRSTSHGPVIYNLKKLAYDITFKKAISKSQHIITVSNYVKNDLVNEYKISNDKITTTYEAVEQSFLEKIKKIRKTDVEKVLKKFDIKKPFLFYVGNAHPHKNVEGLIKAYLEIKNNCHPDQSEGYEKLYSSSSTQNDNNNLQLVLSGHDHYFWERVKKEHQYEDVIYTGFVTDEELVALYKSAKIYVFPSFEEGFGLPLLEAMACGVPVISSDKGSLPEIGGDVAIYFDPYSIKDMVSKIYEVLNSEKLRSELIKKGEKRVKDFNFQKMAEQTLEIYKSIN